MQARRQLTVSLSRPERIAGWIYLPIYLVGLSLVLGLVFTLLGYDITQSDITARLNLIYGLINFAAIVVIFHRYLTESLLPVARRPFWFIGHIALGFVIYYFGTLIVTMLLTMVEPEIQNANNESIAVMAEADLRTMVVFTVLLAPIVEETLFRGLIFSTLHRRSRLLAYGVSMAAFALIHVLGFVGVYPLGQLCLSFLQYLPAGFALAWIYERTDTIWTSIAAHMLVNALSMLAMVSLGGL